MPDRKSETTGYKHQSSEFDVTLNMYSIFIYGTGYYHFISMHNGFKKCNNYKFNYNNYY